VVAVSVLAKELQTFPTEKVFGQRALEPLAKALGYMVYHTGDSRKSHVGFPDYVLLRAYRAPLRLLVVELKLHPETQARGRPTPAQQEWLVAFGAFGQILDGLAAGDVFPKVQSYCWRPPDWFDGTIERLLRA
jgi:hypothetical protein